MIRIVFLIGMCACIAIWMSRAKSGEKLVDELEPLWKQTCACATAGCADEGARKLAQLIHDHGNSTGSPEVVQKTQALTKSIADCATEHGASEAALDEMYGAFR